MKLKHIIAASAVLACANAANAQVAGSLILNAGWNHVMPQKGSSSVGHNVELGNPKGSAGDKLNEPPRGTDPKDLASAQFLKPPKDKKPADESPVKLPSFDLSDLINGGVKADNADTWGLSGTYFMTDNVATELAFSTPARHSLKGTGGLDRFGQVGSFRMWNTSLLLKYYFLNAEDKFRPYLGVGVSRVMFNKERFDLPDAVPGTTTFSLKNKWAAVFNGGFSYQFTDRLFGNVSVSYMPLETTATTRTTLGGYGVVHSSDKLKLNPVTTFVGLGYRF